MSACKETSLIPATALDQEESALEARLAHIRYEKAELQRQLEREQEEKRVHKLRDQRQRIRDQKKPIHSQVLVLHPSEYHDSCSDEFLVIPITEVSPEEQVFWNIYGEKGPLLTSCEDDDKANTRFNFWWEKATSDSSSQAVVSTFYGLAGLSLAMAVTMRR